MPTTNTKTVKSAGGDYSSLSAWEAGRQANLVTGDLIEQAEVYAFNDTTAFTIDGWTTSSTQYIRIYAATGEGHAGYWDTSKYYLSATNANLISVVEDNVRIEGLQIQLTLNAVNDLAALKVTGTGDVRVSRCIARCVVTSDAGVDAIDGFWLAGGGKVYNCVAFGFKETTTFRGSGFKANVATGTFYNCTAYDCDYGFRSLFGLMLAKNCLSFGTGTKDFFEVFDAASDYNCSEDNTAPGAHSLINKASTDIDFLSTTYTDANFLAIDSTSVAVGAGTNDPASGLYSDDIRGTTRTSTWDIGADEYALSTTDTALSVAGAAVGTLATSSRTSVALSATGTAVGTLATSARITADLSTAGAAVGTLVGIDAGATATADLSTAGAATGTLRTALTIAATLSATGAAVGTLDTSSTITTALTAAGAAVGTLAGSAVTGVEETALSAAGASTTILVPAAFVAAALESSGISVATLATGVEENAYLTWGAQARRRRKELEDDDEEVLHLVALLAPRLFGKGALH